MTRWLEIEELRRAVDHVFAEEAQRYKLTIIEMHMLLTLFDRDGQQASHLAKAVGRNPTTFTAPLDSLVRKGLIDRRSNLADRRVVYIHLTTEGEALR